MNSSPLLIAACPSSADCYFDDSPLVITSPWDATITSNLFYGLSGLIVAPQKANVGPRGIMFTSNVFTSTDYSGAGPAITYDTSNGTLNTQALSYMILADNQFDQQTSEKSTRVRSSVAMSGNASVGASTIGGTAGLGGDDDAIAAAIVALRQQWVDATANATLDLRPWLLFLNNATGSSGTPHGGSVAGGWDWRAVAQPVLDRIALGGGRQLGHPQQRQTGASSAHRHAAPRDAGYPVDPSPATPFGGAFAQLQSSAIITSLAVGGQAIPLAGSGLVPLHAVYPTSTPGLLEVVMSLQAISAPGSAWVDAVAAASLRANSDVGDNIDGDGTEASATTYSWTGVVGVAVDQSLPTGIVPQ